jgi:hypothetical protein
MSAFPPQLAGLDEGEDGQAGCCCLACWFRAMPSFAHIIASSSFVNAN